MGKFDANGLTYEPIELKECIFDCGGWMMLPQSRTYTCSECDTKLQAEVSAELTIRRNARNRFSPVAGPGTYQSPVNSRRYKYAEGKWVLL